MKDKAVYGALKLHHVKLDMCLFDPHLLGDEVALEVAIGVLQGHLEDPTVRVEDLVRSLISVPHLFEFMFSAINEEAAARFRYWAIKNFPDDAAEYLNCTAKALLDQISLYLLFLPYPTSSDQPPNLHDCHRSIGLVQPVLNSLVNPGFSAADELAVDDEDISDLFRRVKPKTQRLNKRAKRAPQRVRMDPKLFDDLDVEVPSTQDEANDLVKSILADQRDILEYYFTILRYPHLKDIFRKAYIREGSSVAENPHTDANLAEPETTETHSEGTPTAYPMVQPMRAALYFDSADGFGEWRILISTRGDRDLRQMRKRNFELFKIIVKKIKELSNGHFSEDNQKQLTDTAEIPIYEAKMTRDSRLVYHIDCVPEFESDVERQVVKVFGIYTHNELDRHFWDGVGHQLARRGKEYRRRCTVRNRPRKMGVHSDVVLPASFPPQEEVETPQTSGFPDLHKDDLEKLHEILVLEKYVTFSQALMNSILADQEVAHVFDVSPLEKQIIEHRGSCYVLGRSGTGKTTTMLFKMLGIERSWRAFDQTLPKPRQIFVTQSRVLAEKVQEYFLKLYDSLATADKSAEDIKGIVAARRAQQDQGLVDVDEEIERKGDSSLPQCYKDLRDEHFPIFLSSDQLFRLLESEFGLQESLVQDDPQLSPTQDHGNGRADKFSNDYMQQRRSAFVSYGVFLESYWPHFPHPLTKGSDPALVFGEFMGVIKGSEQSLSSPKSYLDRDAYLALSHRTQGTFANHRDHLYKLFVTYLKLKRERKEYDAADRTHAIVKAMRDKGIPGQQVDFIYVDEAQDNLLIDALVLRSICRNPETGLFWAGDTAQTISIGSAFRFDDLKAFLYRVEKSTRTAVSPSATSANPHSFQLAVNYRSHAGIVDCAHTVIELITRFWPHAIDALAPERGIIEGIKPVFFSGWDVDSARYEQFLFGNTGSQIEFGANQCILVRDDDARSNLRAQVGDIGLIMTLYESKGLEFNDVLLYNFFADSTVDRSQWRVVLNSLPEGQSAYHKAPQFDDARHAGVCRDLKFLYVAITRARKNLWIADSSDKGESMRILWTAKNQVHNCTPGSDVPRLAMSSTPEEWAKTAWELFKNKRYPQAMHCYERAHMHRERAAAHAYQLREVARKLPLTPEPARTAAFVRAAEAFCACAHEATVEKHAYFRIAAECYTITGDHKTAAETYYKATEYTESAQSFRKVGMFDQAVDVVQKHRPLMNETVAGRILEVSKLEYLRQNKIAKARNLFDSDEEALLFMDECGLDIARATYLEELGRHAEAAELLLQEGRTLDAIEVLLRNQQNPLSLLRVSQYLIDGLWQSLPFGVSPSSQIAATNPMLPGLLKNLTVVEVKGLDKSEHDQLSEEITMFKAIIADDTTTLVRLGRRFHHWYKNDAASLLCFDHAFRTLPKLKVSPTADISNSLQNFLLYARLLQKLLFNISPSRNPHIQRLFGFEPSATEELFNIPQNTYLFTQCNDRVTPTVRPTERGVIILRWELEQLIRQVLRDRLYKQVVAENELCRWSRGFQTCLTFCVFGCCNRPSCPQEHIETHSYDVSAYNLRVRIHLQQILVYHTIYNVESLLEQARQHRYWLRQLHEALEPPIYLLGTPHNLRPDLIPEYEEAMHIAKSWAVDSIYYLNPYGNSGFNPHFLTSILRYLNLIVTGNFDALDTYSTSRAPCISEHGPDILMRKSNYVQPRYIVHDYLGFLRLNRPSSLHKCILLSRHIIVNRIPIDISVLCNLLDFLSASFIVARRLRGGGTLHDVTLPLSWLVLLGDTVTILGGFEAYMTNLYVEPMAELLEQIFSGDHTDHLFFEGRELYKMTPQIRSVFVSRVCKNLCLLGYNIGGFRLREIVHHIVTSIRKPGRRFESIIEKYVTAKHWGHLGKTVRETSTLGSPLDEMIQLHLANSTSADLPTFPNVRRIIFRTLDEVPSLLKSGISSASQTVPSVDALQYIPILHKPEDGANLDTMVDEDITRDSTLHGDENGDDVESRDVGEAVDLENVHKSIDAEPEILEPSKPTLEELTAAATIWAEYRRYRGRKAFMRDTQIRSIRHRIFTPFYETSRCMDWPPQSIYKPWSFYKMLYLGPIPHLVVCLEYAQDHLRTEKEKTKKRLREAQHLELEEVRTRQTLITKSLNNAIRLHKELRHDSALHKGQNEEELKARAIEVQQFLDGLSTGAMRECEDDLEIALKGIITRKESPVAKKPNPTLNLGDDLDMEFMV